MDFNRKDTATSKSVTAGINKTNITMCYQRAATNINSVLATQG